MSDAMTDQLIKDLYWQEGEEALWSKVKEDFSRKPEAGRLQDLHTVNQWMDQEGHYPTKELASLLTKRRELEDLNAMLRQLGALMDLAKQLEIAKQKARIERWDRGEAAVASQLKLDVPAVELTPAVHEHFAVFARWCEVRACRKCPAKPKTIACFVIEQKELGVPDHTIVERLEAINAQHQHFGLPSPAHTKIVDAALERVLDIKPPRWDSYSRAEWAKLPPVIRDIISKREAERNKALQKKFEKLRQEAEPNCKSTHIEKDQNYEQNHETR